MPNIYYCHSISETSGMLRAVLSWSEAERLMNLQSAQYVGTHFPKNQNVDFAVLRIFEGERSDGRQAGFYRFNADVEHIEEAIRTCTVKRD